MWELDITEEGCEETHAAVYPLGLTSIRQETTPGSGVEHTVDLSPEQMRKIVLRFCNLTGFYPSPD